MDGGRPSLTGSTTVRINVRRNVHVPSIVTRNRTHFICEESVLGETFETVNAVDRDSSVNT